MLEELRQAQRVVGAKQVRRALSAGTAKKLFAARDADPALIDPLTQQAKAAGIPVAEGFSMQELGSACGIAVGAAVAAAL